MEKIIEKRLDRKTIGFNSEISESISEKEISHLLEQMTPQDLVKFGLIPEFVGRVPVQVALEGLDKDALVRILTEPKNALVKQYRKLFAYDGVDLSFEEDAIESVAQKAHDQKTGARGLRTILEKAMMDVMFTIPSDETVTQCIVTKDSVEGNGQPKVVRRHR